MTTKTISQAHKKYDAYKIENGIRDFWVQNNCYQKTKEHRESGEDYYFVDGPPYTTGSIHLGTAWNKILKDTVIRYRRMNNKNVRDQPGFDMHGLPIEVKVEKVLGIKNKKDINNFGIDKFVSKCKEFAISYQKSMSKQFEDLGVWMDWNHPYLTIKNEYIESTWWTIKKAYEKKLLVQAERVLTWCPRCETALANAEVEFSEKSDPSIYVKFKIDGKENEYILIWTTTPWTIPSNLAVAVHPDFDYIKVELVKEDKKEILYIIEERLEDIMDIGRYDSYKILDIMKGKELEGLKYIHPLLEEVPYHQKINADWAHKVILADYVLKDNTGCVHTAPGFGPDDFETGKKYNIPAFCPIDDTGSFTEEGGKYQGLFVKDSDKIVVEDLKKKGLLFKLEKVVHKYGHCWRCHIPIIYKTTKQWFLKVTELKDKMLDEINKTHWTPDWAGSARFYDWVSNARDWCISRQRYWGIPIPIWKCKCGEIKVIGSSLELKNCENYKEGMDLHIPRIDTITIKCQACDKIMKRVDDILDVWFDSAVCSWASMGYPNRTDEYDKWWPCKWITEAHDQTRGWFYSQLGASIISFDEIPYKSVLMHGFALDEDGSPMSKSSDKVTDPKEITDMYGKDALRFYLIKASAQWEDLPFSLEGVKNANRSLNILWNIYVFSTTYMSLDNFNSEISLKELDKNLRLEDRWLLSKLESLKEEVTKNIDLYDLHKACRALEDFTLDELSRWYIRLIRDRTWIEGDNPDKISAYKILHENLVTLSKLYAPFMPFISEEIYQNLDGKHASVHMCDWPTVKNTRIDKNLERDMIHIRNIVESASNARQKAKIKLRHPIKRIIIKGNDIEIVNAVKSLEKVLLTQVNVKKIEIIEPDNEWEELDLTFQPNYHVLGPIFKQDSNEVGNILKEISPLDLKRKFEDGFVLIFKDKNFEITKEMVNFSTVLPKNIFSSDFEKGMVYIDVEITEEIKGEGFAREIIRRIQEMRKEFDLDIEDYIEVFIKLNEDLNTLIKNWENFICSETRTKKIDFNESFQNGKIKEWVIEREKIVIGIRKKY